MIADSLQTTMQSPTRRLFLGTALAGLLHGQSGSRIRIGCCVPVSAIADAAGAGFDYIEPAAADIASLSDADFAAVKTRVLASPIRCEAFNSFIRRKDLVVVGPAVPLNAVLEYVDSTLERCRQLGATVVVWGSAGSRNVPADFRRNRAWEQIAEFLSQAAPIARRHDITLGIEPLNRKESNILNTGHEALRMVDQVNRPEIALIVDYYHLRAENEDLDIFRPAGKKICHLHFARPAGRIWPQRIDEDPEYAAFFATLRQTKWSGGLSVEGKGTVEADGALAVKVLRALTRPGTTER